MLGDEPLEHGEPLRELADRLGQAGHREAAIISNQLAAGGSKLRPAKTARTNGGIELTKFAQERAGVQVAGRLAARQHEARAQGAGRLKSGGSAGMI